MISYKKPTQRAPEVHKVPGRVQGLPARVGNRGSCHHHHHFHIYFDDNDDNDDDGDDGDDDSGGVEREGIVASGHWQ